MRLLIDGYNLLFQSIVLDHSAQGKNAFRRARGQLIQMVVDLIDESLRNQTMIVFDAKIAPPNLPDRYLQHGIQIVFARDWDSADELIQTEIRKHPTPKLLTVVSSDHAIHRKALARGAQVLDSDEWTDRQRELRARLIRDAAKGDDSTQSIKERELSAEEKARWLNEFGF